MKTFLTALAIALALPFAALAQDKPCSKADATNADKAIDRVTSFAQMQKAWQDWRHCDSGPVAESYNEALFRLLVDWKDVPSLAATTQSSADYKQWVMARVKDASKEDRKAVLSRAKTACPAKQDAFCAELMASASDEQAKALPTLIAPTPSTSAPTLLPAPAPSK